jgi:PIN domain nuclease of toxin-antitoxin system
MSLLLDTHVLLWFLGAPERLRPAVLARIQNAREIVFVSAISVWETELKRALGKLEAPDDLEERLEAQRFTELPLQTRHVRVLRNLPGLHRDPFDRMLAAQAITDQLTLVTADRKLQAYPVKTLRA